jgi:hypothetical protein
MAETSPISTYLYYDDGVAALSSRRCSRLPGTHAAGRQWRCAMARCRHIGRHAGVRPDLTPDAGGATAGIYVTVDDVDAHCERARRGAVIEGELEDKPYGAHVRRPRSQWSSLRSL